jgi:very-short-patch-repair endonuclease
MSKCNVCEKEFIKNVGNKKSCSEECRKEYGRIKTKKFYEEKKNGSRSTSTCITCNKDFEYHFRPERGARKFCGRSCASVFYTAKGTFDIWKNRKNPKNGFYAKCLNQNCQNQVYLTQRFIKHNLKGKVCSIDCEKEYFSQLFMGKNNPMFGRHLTIDQKEKQKSTLQKNYPGIKNAFMLAKHRTKSKAQINIFNFLSIEFPDFNFEIEKLIKNETKELFADIVSFTHKIIIEFYGDYWHCNPQKYDEKYFHAVKQMNAFDIWQSDKERIEILKKCGFFVITIWESDYNKKDWQTSLKQVLEIYEKENINALRSSVNNDSSADVKLGELLENQE